MSTLSLALFTLGRFDEAKTYLQSSIERDPLNLHRLLRLGLLQEFAGQLDDSLSTYRQVMSMNPGYPGLHAYRTRVKVLQNKPESALEESEKELDPFWSLYARILALGALGRDDEALLLLDQIIEERGGEAAYQIAEIMAFREDIDSSFEWLRRARDQRDGGMAELLGNAFLEPLHSDARWSALLAELALPLDAGS
jgi:tetratricopeptide (TPR) repeat protein